jgi:hypothetical protein
MVVSLGNILMREIVLQRAVNLTASSTASTETGEPLAAPQTQTPRAPRRDIVEAVILAKTLTYGWPQLSCACPPATSELKTNELGPGGSYAKFLVPLVRAVSRWYRAPGRSAACKPRVQTSASA